MKKIIAPLIITILILAYFALYAFGVVSIGVPMPFSIVLIVVLSGLAGTSIYVFIERIKEIRSGEEDDLSKY